MTNKPQSRKKHLVNKNVQTIKKQQKVNISQPAKRQGLFASIFTRKKDKQQ